MTDKILDNLMLLSQHVCDMAPSSITGSELSTLITELEEYLDTIRRVRDLGSDKPW
jgi:hypothetical protein